MGSLFKKIIDKEIPADIVFENDRIVAFKDIHPVAPVHLLIVPKKEIRDIQSLSAEDLPLVGEMIQVAQKLAKEYNVADGYRLLMNNGAKAGQTIFHLHFHLIGGKILGAMA
jgi:histidine triad (HIT) family protein